MLCLKCPTDEAWTAEAMGNLDAVLVDHAHCEMKAASNALSLATRHSDDIELVVALSDVAREEITHFQRVLAILAARGVPLGSPPVDAYAADLRKAATSSGRRSNAASGVDRLLVGALIEARSCERFKLLAEATSGGRGPAELHALWADLLACEAQHYRSFVDLAVRCAGGDREAVVTRLDELAKAEAAIVKALPRSPRGPRAAIHG